MRFFGLLPCVLLGKNVVTSFQTIRFSLATQKLYCTNFIKKLDSNEGRIEKEVVGAKNNVGLIRLETSDAYNVIKTSRLLKLVDVINEFDADDSIATIIITGTDKVFTTGGDINEYRCLDKKYPVHEFEDNHDKYTSISRCQKPIIAAVNGFVMGTGMEIVMMCDIIYAGESAKFVLPDVKIGVVPGAGGTQRLPRAVGKSKAMEMVLSCKAVGAFEAERIGLVNRVFPVEMLLEESIKVAEHIGSHSLLAVRLAKQAINQAYSNNSLHNGLAIEKLLFYNSLQSVNKDKQRHHTFPNDATI